MKLTDEMDVDATEISMTNGDPLPICDSLKTSRTLLATEDISKPLSSNCQNEITHTTENVLGGKMSPDSPNYDNLDSDGIGIEVETYSHCNSPHQSNNHSEDEFYSNSLSDNKCKINLIENSSCVDSNSTSGKHRNDCGLTDLDKSHDSSHLSEEFQLRLSDDEDDIEGQVRRNRVGENVTVSSTTEDSISSISSDSTKGDTERPSGSGTVILKEDCCKSLSLGKESTEEIASETPKGADMKQQDEEIKENGDDLLDTSQKTSLSDPVVHDNSSAKCDDSNDQDSIILENLKQRRDEKIGDLGFSCEPGENVESFVSKDSNEASEASVTRNNAEASSLKVAVNESNADACQLNTEDTVCKEMMKDISFDSLQNWNELSVEGEQESEVLVTPQCNIVCSSGADNEIRDEEFVLLEDQEPSSKNLQSVDGDSSPTKGKTMKFDTSVKVLSDVSLEDTIEAELEAELAAERAAQIHTKDDVQSTCSMHMNSHEPSGTPISHEPDVEKARDEPVSSKDINCTFKQSSAGVELPKDTLTPNVNETELNEIKMEDNKSGSAVCKQIDLKDCKSIFDESKIDVIDKNIGVLLEPIIKSLESPPSSPGRRDKLPIEKDCKDDGDKSAAIPIPNENDSTLSCLKDVVLPKFSEERDHILGLVQEDTASSAFEESDVLPAVACKDDSENFLSLRVIESAINPDQDEKGKKEVPPTEKLDSKVIQEGTHSAVQEGSEFEKLAGGENRESMDEHFLLNSPHDPSAKELTENETLSNSLPALSQSNSPASEVDFSSRDLHEDSDSSSSDESNDNSERTLNDDYDSNCEKYDATRPRTADKNDEDLRKMSDVNKISTLEFTDSNLSMSPITCDSTGLDASSTDDLDSQDCSSITNQSHTSKGLNSTRKRTLSQSEDDSTTLYRKKKLNGLTSNASNSVSDVNDNGHKRPAEVTIDTESKKLRKVNSDGVLVSKTALTGSVDLPFLRRLHKKKLSQMSRSDLEELVLQKICEAITERSIVGDLRVRCQALEKRQEKENEKFNKLRKQMTELSLVMKKYMDMQNKNEPAPPMKVTRSVGLQVSQSTRQVVPNHPLLKTSHLQTPPAKQLQTSSRQVPANPTRSDFLSDPSQNIPSKSYKAPVFGPRPSTNVVSTDPPALIPTCSQNTTSVPVPTGPTKTPPRSVPIPPLHQIVGARPRFSVTPTPVTSVTTLVPAVPRHTSTPNRPITPQNTNRKTPVNNDVEVIDIIEKDEQNIRPVGIQISAQQQQHQQKQAANAAAQSLLGHSGMTVRLISPTQISQAMPTYPQLIVPSSNIQQKMIITSPPGNRIRQGVKLLMKASTVPSSVVRIPASAQAAVQQIFTNANTGSRTSTVGTVRQVPSSLVHPAPLPPGPAIQTSNPAWKQLPPRPNLKIQHQNNGIVLSWNMALGPTYAEIESYQLYAYQEGTAPPSAGLWKKVGDVKALPLPMACTLTQFVEGHRYHFTVRAVDKHGRVGPFSHQGSIRLGS